MTLGFAECMPENDDLVYHVAWLQNQQVFPPLSSTITGNDIQYAATETAQDDWEFLHRQEILQAQEEFPMDGGHHHLKTCEMEDTWQQVDVLREKQFVDVAAEATHLPQRSKMAPIKPQRHRSPAPKLPMTEEQQRHFYWEMIDQLEEEETMHGGGTGDFYDLYYDRKSHSNHKNNSKYNRRHHMDVWKRWHHRLEIGDLGNEKKMERLMDYLQRPMLDNHPHTNVKATCEGLHALNPRLIHTLVMSRHHHHLDRSSSGSTPGSKVFKSLMEPDFCLQVKNG